MPDVSIDVDVEIEGNMVRVANVTFGGGESQPAITDPVALAGEQGIVAGSWSVALYGFAGTPNDYPERWYIAFGGWPAVWPPR